VPQLRECLFLSRPGNCIFNVLSAREVAMIESKQQRVPGYFAREPQRRIRGIAG
jgi:hypothetical protein